MENRKATLGDRLVDLLEEKEERVMNGKSTKKISRDIKEILKMFRIAAIQRMLEKLNDEIKQNRFKGEPKTKFAYLVKKLNKIELL